MPTGYTAAVADGEITTLRQFALQCARGMGALIMMRDDPWGAPIPEKFEPHTSYYDERLAAAAALLAEVRALTEEQCEQRARAEYETAVAERARYVADKDAQRQRYDAMLAQTRDWECGAEGLKDFMLEQLQTGRDGDCRDDMSWYPAPEPKSGSEWRLAVTEKATHDITYNAAERAKEVARTDARNGWLKALRESLAKATGEAP